MPDNKIKSLEQLRSLQKQIVAEKSKYKARVLICMTGCRALGAQQVCDAFRDELAKSPLCDEVEVVEVGCIGICAAAPVVLIEPYDYLYGKVKPEDIPEIIETTLSQGKPVERLTVTEDGKSLPKMDDIPFYKKQQRLVLANCGRIDPRRIEDSIAAGGYASAIKALTQKDPQQVIDEITRSGLRGRGGGGFPTGVKWGFCRKSPGDQKYLICNADEGDPGAFMDRALLEGDPHRVIEGMITAAYATGATKGFIYVRAEYPIAVEHINLAIEQAKSLGLLGKDIAGSGVDFDLDVRTGAGAFVCGEETALIASLEGERGMPRPRPPFPAVKGYKGRPSNINNVETFANVPVIMETGPEKYSAIGTEKSKGTKIFALAGKVTYTGLVEVPMGTTLREIVFGIGGGIPEGGEFKAAQLGGPSGGCIPSKFLDHEIDYDSLQEIGAIMGSGGLIVMDQSTCMVDVARYFLDFTQSESCGKCTPCRVGTAKMLHILQDICDGKPEGIDLDELMKLGENIKAASLCGLGQTAPNPVLSTITHFREEYRLHIEDYTCQSGVCKGLLGYEIIEVCVGCGACKKVCLNDAITGEKKALHAIDKDKCIKCGQCFTACKFKAVKR